MTRIDHDADFPAAPTLSRALGSPATRRQRAVYLVAGTLAAAGLGAGVGAYTVGLLSQDDLYVTVRCAETATTPPALATLPPAPVAEVVAPTPRPGAIELGLIAQTDATYALLTTEIDEAWMRGAPRVHGEGMTTALSRDVDLDALPAELAAAIGDEVSLYGTHGEQCTARVTGLVVLGRYIDGGYFEGEASWDAAEGSLALAARLERVDGDCGDAIWARSTSLPAPALAEVSDAPADVRAAALAAFRALPAYLEVQNDFGREAPWDTSEGAMATVSVVSGDGVELVIAESQVGICGEFEASLVAVWRRDDGGALVPVTVDIEREPLAIDAAADLDGDGQPELFYNPDAFDRGVLRSEGAGYVAGEEVHVPFYGCRC